MENHEVESSEVVDIAKESSIVNLSQISVKPCFSISEACIIRSKETEEAGIEEVYRLRSERNALVEECVSPSTPDEVVIPQEQTPEKIIGDFFENITWLQNPENLERNPQEKMDRWQREVAEMIRTMLQLPKHGTFQEMVRLVEVGTNGDYVWSPVYEKDQELLKNIIKGIKRNDVKILGNKYAEYYARSSVRQNSTILIHKDVPYVHSFETNGRMEEAVLTFNEKGIPPIIILEQLLQDAGYVLIERHNLQPDLLSKLERDNSLDLFIQRELLD